MAFLAPHPLTATGGTIMPDRLYTPNEACAILGIASKTLQEWRREGRGPTVTRLRENGPPRYRGQHLLDAMEAAADPTNTAGVRREAI